MYVILENLVPVLRCMKDREWLGGWVTTGDGGGWEFGQICKPERRKRTVVKLRILSKINSDRHEKEVEAEDAGRQQNSWTIRKRASHREISRERNKMHQGYSKTEEKWRGWRRDISQSDEGQTNSIQRTWNVTCTFDLAVLPLTFLHINLLPQDISIIILHTYRLIRGIRISLFVVSSFTYICISRRARIPNISFNLGKSSNQSSYVSFAFATEGMKNRYSKRSSGTFRFRTEIWVGGNWPSGNRSPLFQKVSLPL